VLVHGFTDTWRTWELVLPALERHHEVLALTLPGHAGGPSLREPVANRMLADAVEAAMDEAGWATAHVAGNSLGGYVALQLAERGRARSVVALAPAGGWAHDDHSWREVLGYFVGMQEQVRQVAPHAAAVAANPNGRRAATQMITVRWEHLGAPLVEHLIVGAARCDGAATLIANATEHGWPLDPARVDCPLRFVWGRDDQLLRWPGAAAGFRAAFPTAEWIELDGVGHCPQLDVPLETAQLILGQTAS
jgi:pimeloyl-ACP methyl ester carboxylesterase